MANYLAPDWANAALVIIDVQRDFVSGPAAIPGTDVAVPAMAVAAAEFRRLGRPIIHVVRSYSPGESDVDLLRRSAVEGGAAMVVPGTPGAEIVPELLPGPIEFDWESLRFGAFQQIGDAEYVLYKPRWSAFFRTPLDSLLGDLGVSTVVVAGANLPNCPRATLFDASELDYRTVLITDATSQTTPERLADFELIGVQLRSADEVVSALSDDELLGAAESLWVSVLGHVERDNFDRASGCGEWTVRELVDHVAGGADRTAILLRGGTSDDTATTRGLDYIGDDAVGSFWSQEHLMREAAANADLSAPVDYRLGERSGEALMQIRVLELVLHSKDLADANGDAWDPPADLVEFLLGTGSTVIEEFRAFGAVGPELPVAEDATPGERLLAFAGRASR